MTQGENVNPYPRKQKKGKKEDFQSKKKRGKEISNQRERKEEERKFPIKEWEKEKRKESQILNSSCDEHKTSNN